MKLLILSATFDKLSTRADKSIQLVFTTQELPTGDLTALLSNIHQYVHLGIKDAEIEAMDVDELMNAGSDPDDFAKGKSQSQRIRDHLFVWWKQSFEGKEEWEVFYRRQTNVIIEKLKEKLEP